MGLTAEPVLVGEAIALRPALSIRRVKVAEVPVTVNGQLAAVTILQMSGGGDYDDPHHSGAPEQASRGGEFLDELKNAKDAFRNDKDFRRWWHRNYKTHQKIPGGGRKNPDLPDEDILHGYLEWIELGKPKG